MILLNKSLPADLLPHQGSVCLYIYAIGYLHFSLYCGVVNMPQLTPNYINVILPQNSTSKSCTLTPV